MKKYITTFIFVIVSFVSLYAVWEGNGVAGVATDFKEDGMFVQSSLFPKYTLVEILNLENDIKVRSIVLEGSQPPGILMSFSPSVAEALKVPYGKVARIRVVSPSIVSEGDEHNIVSGKNETNFDIEEGGENIEADDSILIAEDKVFPKEVKDLKMENESSTDKDEVLLYDFQPFSKAIEKKGKDEGAVSFDPAFIEEDISINLNIPEKSLDDVPIEIEKKEKSKKIEPIKEKPIEKKAITIPTLPEKPETAPEIEKKKEVEKVTSVLPPKEVSTVFRRDIYLEKTGAKPPEQVIIPKDVPSPKMNKKEEIPQIQDVVSVDRIEIKKEEEKERLEDVKNVLMTEKKEECKGEPIFIVDEVPQIDIQKESQDKMEDEKELFDIRVLKNDRESKKDDKSVRQLDENEENVEDVDDAPPIKKEEKELAKNESVQVDEVMSPFSSMNKIKADEKIEDVKEIEKVEDKENEEKFSIVEPVKIVDKTKEKESEKLEDVPDVSIVSSIKDKSIEEDIEDVQEDDDKKESKETEPIEEEPLGEDEVPIEEAEESPQEEEVKENDEDLKGEGSEEKTPIEENGLEDSHEVGKQQINERPLREIQVYNTARNRIDVQASKEDVDLSSNKNIRAIEDYEVKGSNEVSSISDRESALDEVKVSPKKEEVAKKREEQLDEATPEKEKEKEEIIYEPAPKDQDDIIGDNREEEREEQEPLIQEPEKVNKIGTKEQIIEDQIKKDNSFSAIESGKEKEESKKDEREKNIKKEIENNENDEGFPIGKTINGYTYVQIAVYNSATNVDETIRRYGGRYPIVVEKRGKGKYVVFIGPLQKHEAGAIQELFKGFGFSGCFVR